MMSPNSDEKTEEKFFENGYEYIWHEGHGGELGFRAVDPRQSVELDWAVLKAWLRPVVSEKRELTKKTPQM